MSVLFRSTFVRSALIGALLIPVAGCYSKADGTRLARSSEHHDARLTALERGMEEERLQMQTALESAQAKVVELEQVLERATQVVTRNSADLGTEVSQLREQLQTLEGTLAELRNELTNTQRQVGEQQTRFDERFQQFARKSGVDMPVPESEIPAAKDDHFTAAYQAYQREEHSQARALFRAYITRYAEDENADNALYWIGKSYLAENRPASALREFRRVISSYATGDAMDETLFDMGEAFFALHACTDARNAFQTLTSNFRRSPLAGRARQRIREIRRAPGSACTS